MELYSATIKVCFVTASQNDVSILQLSIKTQLFNM